MPSRGAGRHVHALHFVTGENMAPIKIRGTAFYPRLDRILSIASACSADTFAPL
jgi:hypothetical protein